MFFFLEILKKDFSWKGDLFYDLKGGMKIYLGIYIL